MRLTPQRLAIISFLEGNICHPSAEEIYREIKDRYPTTSFATVYATLAALVKKGWLSEITIDKNKRRYDPNTLEHDHLVCTYCGLIADIEKTCSPIIQHLGAYGFSVKGSRTEFYGICSSCISNTTKQKED